MSSLRIGICCSPTFGGSGIVATEIGLALAARGHRIDFITTGVPRRLSHCPSNVTLHEVSVREYPMLSSTPHSLALASKLVSIAKWKSLDLIHVHYAIPHAASAAMAKSILGKASPKLVTTLHGTDVTMLTDDVDYRPVIKWSIEQSDAVTVPSQWLHDETLNRLSISKSIDVIPNFVNTEEFTPDGDGRTAIEALFAHHDGQALRPDYPVLIHISNFRPVKRVEHVIEVFARLNPLLKARLLLVGDGPQRSQVEALVQQRDLAHRVRFMGKVRDFAHLLRASDLFLFTSASESFGLAALEAQACGVPVIASLVGGLPEVIQHGRTGILTPDGDISAMVKAVEGLLSDHSKRHQMAHEAREQVLHKFQRSPIVERYEQLYQRIIR